MELAPAKSELKTFQTRRIASFPTQENSKEKITQGHELVRTITNNYRDSHLLNLGSGGERGPYLVTQTGVSPNDALPKERMFVLRPDGHWVDFNAYASQGKPEAMDDIVFSSTTEVMAMFSKLLGRPRVLDLPVDEAGLKAWLERQTSGDPLQAARDWAVGYQERRKKRRG
jgi:hypothetical protein